MCVSRLSGRTGRVRRWFWSRDAGRSAGFVLDPTLEQNRTAIRDVSRITHHSDEAYVGALAVAIAVRM